MEDSGAEKRTRTSTGFPPQTPEACVSTNSTISANASVVEGKSGFILSIQEKKVKLSTIS
ncbi:MAG: hypothetical protein RLZ35_352 [Pseudomonadota bacterium]